MRQKEVIAIMGLEERRYEGRESIDTNEKDAQIPVDERFTDWRDDLLGLENKGQRQPKEPKEKVAVKPKNKIDNGDSL